MKAPFASLKKKSGGSIVTTIMTAVSFLLAVFLFDAGAESANTGQDSSNLAIQQGQATFTSLCQNCHSLKYFGYQARLPAALAQTAFGKVPPDLSLMARARGRGSRGTQYIYSLLTSYNNTSQENSVFPNIAMPPPFSPTDPQLKEKAKDVAAFLTYAADPSAGERRWLGKFVVAYMVVLTALLFSLNRRVWKRVEKRQT